jgi:hypothetical protein
MTVETDTANIAPLGMRMGNADASAVKKIQNARPPIGAAAPIDSNPREMGIQGSTGNRRVVATSATALVATTPAM